MTTTKPVWYEVFISDEIQGSETVASFDTLEEALEFASDKDVHIDEWTLDETDSPIITKQIK